MLIRDLFKPTLLFAPDEGGGGGEHDVAAASAAAELATSAQGVQDGGEPEGSDPPDPDAEGVEQSEEGEQAEEKPVDIDELLKEAKLDKNRMAEIARKKGVLDKLNAQIAEARKTVESPDPEKPEKAEGGEEAEFEDEYDKKLKDLAEQNARLQARFDEMDAAEQKAKYDKAVNDYVTAIYDGAYDLADKLFPDLSDTARSSMHEFIEDKMDRAAKINQSKGIEASEEVINEMSRNAVAAYRSFVGEHAEAQIRDSQITKTKHPVGPDVGSPGTPGPVDESKLPPDKLAAAQRQRAEAAEAYAKAHGG